jgi:hypothetical protein
VHRCCSASRRSAKAVEQLSVASRPLFREQLSWCWKPKTALAIREERNRLSLGIPQVSQALIPLAMSRPCWWLIGCLSMLAQLRSI